MIKNEFSTTNFQVKPAGQTVNPRWRGAGPFFGSSFNKYAKTQLKKSDNIEFQHYRIFN